jgi:translation initiation factor IF-3
VSFDHAVNERIRAREVRLVGDAGEQLGVHLTHVALSEARKLGMDLVEIQANATPPVCRIVDYGKFRFELSKSEKERAKKMREAQIDTKEIQLRPVTDDHDVGVKAKRAREFLADGDRVKIVVKFKGRELAHKEIGRRVLDAFLDAVGEHRVEKPPAMSERNLIALVAPMPKKAD